MFEKNVAEGPRFKVLLKGAFRSGMLKADMNEDKGRTRVINASYGTNLAVLLNFKIDTGSG